MSKKNIAYVNHAMLKWARSETPFSEIEDVVTRAPFLSLEKILAWENGEDLPSITEAKKLAALYDVPFACLFYSKIPEKKIRPYTDRRTISESFFGNMSYELWTEIRRIMANRDLALEVSPDIENRYKPLPIIKSKDDTKTVAEVIRSFFGIETPFEFKSNYGNTAFNYFRDKLESKGIMVAQIGGIDVSEIRGLSIFNNVMPIIAINNKDWERAKVFSLFHEVAHLLRRSSSLCLIDFNERSDNEEKICDKIAAETLLPEKTFKSLSSTIKKEFGDWNDNCLLKIADLYAVSTAVVLRRLYELGTISKSYYITRYSQLADEFEKNKNYNKENIIVKYHYRFLNKQGYLFPRTILTAYANGIITYGEMCRSLNVNSMHIGNIEQAVMYR